MKFVVEIPDDAKVTADEVRQAVRFGFGYWSELTTPQLDAITVATGVLGTVEASRGGEQ